MTKDALAKALAKTILVNSGGGGSYKPYTPETIQLLFNFEELYKLVTKSDASRKRDA